MLTKQQIIKNNFFEELHALIHNYNLELDRIAGTKLEFDIFNNKSDASAFIDELRWLIEDLQEIYKKIKEDNKNVN